MLLQAGLVPNTNLMPLALVGSELQVLSWNGRGIVVHRNKEFHNQATAIKGLAIIGMSCAFRKYMASLLLSKPSFVVCCLVGMFVCLFAETRIGPKILLLEVL